MREQVATQKVGHRSGISGKGRTNALPQRPTRRERDGGESLAVRLRSLANYIPLLLKIGLVLTVAILAFLAYRAAASASFFALRDVEVQGTTRANRDDIKAIVKKVVKDDGVWRADLDAISKNLQSVPWVRSAVVTRVLPDSIRVRIVERQSVAVVRTATGRFQWVDEDAVFLGEMSSADQVPTFFLHGWNEDGSQSARAENRERVKKFVSLQREWDAKGLSERVSEVNLGDLRDVRVQLAGNDAEIEMRLGGQDQENRLGKALNVLDAQRNTALGPMISYVDLTQGVRAVIGTVSGAHAVTNENSSDISSQSNAQSVERTTNEVNAREKSKTQKVRKENKKADQKRT
jgi:cell division septal protein FtsQ